MRLLVAILLLPTIAGQGLVIPEVKRAVSAQLNEFIKYMNEHSSTTTNSIPSVPLNPEQKKVEERQVAGSYWYESIAHQGISAFNINRATYKVYRNVKDYGAKGYEQLTIPRVVLMNEIEMGKLTIQLPSTRQLVMATDVHRGAAYHLARRTLSSTSLLEPI